MKFNTENLVVGISLLIALLFFYSGIDLIKEGVLSDGVIDIRTSLITGRVESGSVGLSVVFLSFFLVVFALSSLDKSRFRKFLPLFLFSLSLYVVFVYSGNDGAAFFSGFLTIVSLAVLIALLSNERE